MKIRTKLILSFLILICMMFVLTSYSLYNIKQIQKLNEEMYYINTVPIGHLGEITECIQRKRTGLRDMILYNDINKKQEKLNIVNDLNSRLETNMDDFSKSISSDEVKNGFQLLKLSLDKYKNVEEKLISYSMNNHSELALQVLNENYQLAQEIQTNIDKLKEIKISQAKQKSLQSQDKVKSIIFITIFLIIISISIAVGLSLLIIRSINKPIIELTNNTDLVANGDLTTEININTKDELGLLANSFKDMLNNMKEMVKLINSKASTLAAASQQLSASSQQTSATSAETAATMSQISITVEDMAHKTDEIKKITNGVTDISDNINLLSLNASIEAARAGEHGRGFAVVAQEISKLADKSILLADEINKIINELLKSVNEVSSSISNIAAATEEQNASMEEVAGSSEELSHGAEELNNYIQKYKI